jgi:5-methyltetrahydrofolate--homocysteine methyltransferase
MIAERGWLAVRRNAHRMIKEDATMSREEILEGLKSAIIELDDVQVDKLLDEGLAQGLAPMEMITEGLSAGLFILGEGFAKAERFMSELMIAADIMNVAVEKLRPLLEKAGGPAAGETMVLGTVEGDLHDIGRRIVGAVFTGAGYQVIDLGGNVSAGEFVKAAKEHKATVVGASAILSPVKPYCKVVNDALVEAGLRDDVIFVVGGWDMDQDWCDMVGADCFGKDALDGLNKVKLIREGKQPKWKERVRK